MPDLDKNKITLGQNGDLNENLKPIKIGELLSPIQLSNKVVRIVPDVIFKLGNALELSADNSQNNTLKGNINVVGGLSLNGSAVQTGADLGATQLNDLTDVTYASGDLTIASLDKIIVAGDLDIIAAGGDINFKASEHGSGYDGGVNFNITSNQVEFIRDLQGGTPSRLTFNIGTTQHSINSAAKLEFISDEICEFRHKSLVKPLAFDRDGLSLTTGNNWSAMAAFEDSINTTDSATGNDIYGLMRGHLRYLTTSGFNKVCLLRLESDAMLSSVAFVNYNATVAGTIKGTKTDHGYVTGVTIEITETTDYNGQEVVTRIDDDNFYFTDTYTSDQSGTTEKSDTTIHTSDIYGKFSVEKNGSTYSKGSVNLLESADHPETPAATLGQVWVKTATPNELYFTTDAGNDIQLTAGTATAGKFFLNVGCYYGTSAKKWLPLAQGEYDQTTYPIDYATDNANFIVPYDMKINTIYVNHNRAASGQSQPSTTRIQLYKGGSAYSGDVTIVIDGSGYDAVDTAVVYTFDFSGETNTFSAGEVMAISLDPANIAYYFAITICGEYV